MRGVQNIAWWWSRRKVGGGGTGSRRVEDGLKQEPGKGRTGITTSGTWVRQKWRARGVRGDFPFPFPDFGGGKTLEEEEQGGSSDLLGQK